MAEGGYLLGQIDDYFPDYQFGCCMITLLNNHMAKGAAKAAFFVP